jgi:hypothetical protein
MVKGDLTLGSNPYRRESTNASSIMVSFLRILSPSSDSQNRQALETSVVINLASGRLHAYAAIVLWLSSVTRCASSFKTG